MLEEVCWDVVCYSGHEMGGKGSFADVRQRCSLIFIL